MTSSRTIPPSSAGWTTTNGACASARTWSGKPRRRGRARAIQLLRRASRASIASRSDSRCGASRASAPAARCRAAEHGTSSERGGRPSGTGPTALRGLPFPQLGPPRSGRKTRTTSRPGLSAPWRNQAAPRGRSAGATPCHALVGKACGCFASPRRRSGPRASHVCATRPAGLRSGGGRKKWPSEWMLKVRWWHRKTRTAPPQSAVGDAAGDRPGERHPEPNGTASRRAPRHRNVGRPRAPPVGRAGRR